MRGELGHRHASDGVIGLAPIHGVALVAYTHTHVTPVSGEWNAGAEELQEPAELQAPEPAEQPVEPMTTEPEVLSTPPGLEVLGVPEPAAEEHVEVKEAATSE